MTEDQAGAAPDTAAESPPPRLHGVVDIAGWMREGWRIYKTEPLVFALVTAIYAMLLLIAANIPVVGLLLAGPFSVGFYLVVADISLGRVFNVWRLFEGFKYFLPAAVAYFAITFFTVIGFILLIIPGIIVTAWYLFAFLFIADRGYGFWQAMEASRQLVRQDTTGFVFFLGAMGLLNLLGALCLVLGLLVTMPVTYIATFAAYRGLMGLQKLSDQPSPPPLHI